ncbi:MAG: HAD family hydrolase [Sedimentisphaerales bacterium]|nr:HAD family hydrolase [Sedimentisphaerales bacterium]
MITTVVFDLDDTLYDEIEYCRTGFTAVAELLAELPQAPSAGSIFSALWNKFTAGNRKNTFNAALDELGISYDDKLIDELVNVYRSHNPAIKLPQDSRDVLCELRAKYTLALITDGFLPAQQLKVKSLGIEKYFKCIVYTEQLGREFWKPSPTGFKKILQTLNAKPENTVYIADNEKKDFIAPNKLGFFTVQLIRHKRLHTSVSSDPDGQAQHVINEITQLPALLEGL